MNIQQLRYVVAIAHSGTFREAANQLYVSQPSLSVSVKDLEEELGFKIFRRTTAGVQLTRRGQIFLEKAQHLLDQFDHFEQQYLSTEDSVKEFSIASQHYDFLPPLMAEFSKRYPEYKSLRIFESTTVQILDDVIDGHSDLGIIYMNDQNREGIIKKMDKQGLEFMTLIAFQTHIYLRKSHPLTSKPYLCLDDLKGLPTARFTQEKDEYLYYSENLVASGEPSMTYHVTDRATLNGILERTDAYATGSGFLDQNSVNGITVIPLKDATDNQMVYVKRRDVKLSTCGQRFVEVMRAYFDTYKPEVRIEE